MFVSFYSVRGCSSNSTVYAMAKHRKRLKRKRTSSSTTSNSSCSSGSSSSSASSCSATSSVEPARPSKVRESKTAALSAFRFQDKTRVFTQKPQFDPTDGAIVYSTMDVTCFKTAGYQGSVHKLEQALLLPQAFLQTVPRSQTNQPR